MQGLILAAGMGKRLKHLTQDNTKCMVKVNGVSMIERVLHQLDERNLSRIIIVVGYKEEELIKYISSLDVKTPIKYISNPIYDKTNNIYSLALAKNELQEEDTLLLESDLIFEDSVLDAIIDDERETLALVDKFESWMDGTCVKIDDEDNIVDFVPGKKFVYEDIPKYYKTVNIYKFSKEFSVTHYVPFLDAYSKALGNNEYYEQVLRVITMLDDPEIKAKRLDGQKWYEIDDIQDLDIASSIFAKDDDEKLTMIQRRYGGYWRYPKLLDYCYLVNPYFPPQKLVNEIKANFETLLTQYPSGMSINCLLAAKKFNVNQDYIVVGNGAAELIKSFMENASGRVGIVRPTFEEYPNRYCSKEDQVVFVPQTDDFSYNEEDLISFFGDKELSTLLLINPDNPSGNYISRDGAIKLIDWCNKNDICLVLDESFIDFSDEVGVTYIDDELLEEYRKLVVVKSISKSYGVPGARLGVLASSNVELIDRIKKDVAIWNINSFGEFFMQIEEKYKKDYAASLEHLRMERARFVNMLNEFKQLKAFDSQANFVMVELFGGMTSRELTRELLNKDIFIKDLSPKLSCGDRQFIRLAVRDEKDNDNLISALKTMLD